MEKGKRTCQHGKGETGSPDRQLIEVSSSSPLRKKGPLLIAGRKDPCCRDLGVCLVAGANDVAGSGS
jgi:hypothetical protein